MSNFERRIYPAVAVASRQKCGLRRETADAADVASRNIVNDGMDAREALSRLGRLEALRLSFASPRLRVILVHAIETNGFCAARR
jgi:hypothetical protein